MNICPVDNIVRWRFANEDSGTSNATTINSVMSKSGTGGATSAGLMVNDLDPSGAPSLPIESNSRLVEWSDGTFSLVIGDEVFDIRHESLPDSGIFLKADTELAVLKGSIDQKIFVKPTVRSNRHV